jgi:threonine dehydratase
VFASINANPLKIEAMRRFGAEVFLAGEDFDAAKEAAKIYAAERKLQFVEDGASAAIAEGAGTIAAELTEEVEDIDAVFIPLGNGALAAGVGCWFKSRSPRTRVVAVAAKGAPCMALSYNAGDVISTPEARTIADGIAVRIPVPSAVGWLKDTIDDVVLVDDDQLLDAMRFAHDTWKRLVEPAGAAGLAAILAQASAVKGCRVATMLCGANLTDQQIEAWLPSAMKHNTNAC